MKRRLQTRYDPKADPVVTSFSAEIHQRLGQHLRQLCLFGSRARGDARADSDYDMLVVVDQRSPEIRAIILDIEVNILDQHQALVASIVRSEDEWLCGQGFPLARNIARESVQL